MYILKNALVSITRNKGRNLLIGIIVIVIACATTITLAIKSSATNLINSYENQYDVTATIGINRDAMRGEMQGNINMSDKEREEQKNNMQELFQSVSSITKEDVAKYGDSNYVKEYYYTLNIGVNADSLTSASSASNNSGFSGGRGGKGNFGNLTASDFTLQGYSDFYGMNEFISGKYTIKDGSLSNDLESMTCVINSELASINNLNVNDKIKFIDPDNEDNTITLTVSGIFEEKSDNSDAMGMFTTSANTIITNVSTVNTLINGNSDMKTSLTPTFILKSKEVIEAFTNELTKKGLSEYLTVTTNLDQVENATSTISNVNTFASVFLSLTLIIGGVVLFVINMINIRERRYEIGVLRTIGMKKKYLTIEFISELLIVSFIALLIGGCLGAASSVPVSNYLLQNEIAESKEQKENVKENFGGKMETMNKVSGIANIQAFDSIDAVVDLKVLLQLFGIGTLLTLVSSTAGVLSIQKFSPLTILKERS